MGRHTAKVDVCAPSNILDADWSDFDDKEGENPVGSRGESGSSLTNSQWRILSGNYVGVSTEELVLCSNYENTYAARE